MIPSTTPLSNPVSAGQLMRAATNKNALAIMAGGLSTGVLVAASSSMPGNPIILSIGILVGFFIVFYAVNATGYLLTQQAPTNSHTEKVPSVLQALRWSLARSHVVLGVNLLIIIGVAALSTVAGLVLLLCKLPAIGTTLYAFVLPAMILFFGLLVLCATALLGLGTASVWRGHGAVVTLKQLLTMPARQWVGVLGQLGRLLLSFTGTCFLVILVLAIGWRIASELSNLVLFNQVVDQVDLLSGDNSFERAGFIGILVGWGVGLMFPTLVLIAGLCRIDTRSPD